MRLTETRHTHLLYWYNTNQNILKSCDTFDDHLMYVPEFFDMTCDDVLDFLDYKQCYGTLLSVTFLGNDARYVGRLTTHVLDKGFTQLALDPFNKILTVYAKDLETAKKAILGIMDKGPETILLHTPEKSMIFNVNGLEDC